MNRIKVGMAGLGMIVEETYLPCFRELIRRPLYSRKTGPVEVEFTAAATRTGLRAEKCKAEWPKLKNISGPSAVEDLLQQQIDVVCVATPDQRHFDIAKRSLESGKHVLIEKPSVLSIHEWDVLVELARRNQRLAKVVYHKLFDPDHKKLRTLTIDGVLQHVNNGYCSLLEPKSISKGQFAEWIHGRNPASYVAVHYLKLIDFTFGPEWSLERITATGQRGLTGPFDGKTWDSVQTQVVYQHQDCRTAAFDIHTSWVMPDNFPGYVEQDVQFRFDNGMWTASQRKRGVELTVEGRTPQELKITPNYHYNSAFLEPNGERRQRGYGIEAIHDFLEQVAYVEYGGSIDERSARLLEMTSQSHNDLSADRNVVTAVEAVESILNLATDGRPSAIVQRFGDDFQLCHPQPA